MYSTWRSLALLANLSIGTQIMTWPGNHMFKVCETLENLGNEGTKGNQRNRENKHREQL